MKIGLLLKAEIQSTFEVVHGRCTSEEIVFVCPQPGCGDKTGNRAVNLKTGKTNCWRCGVAGSFLWWAKALGYRFENADDISEDTLQALEQAQRRSVLPLVQAVQLPKGFTPITEEPDAIRSRYIVEMAVRKNLDREAFEEANVGFTRDAPKWEEYAIFPVVEHGVIVYWQGRTYHDKPGESTKLFPSRDEVKYGARYWVYNIDEVRARKANIVIAVESILNVLSLRRKLNELNWTNVVPVCVFKHRVSMEQALKLHNLKHVQEVCLMFDHDATAKAWESGRQLTNAFALTVAEMPPGPDNKKFDPNDDVEAAIDAFEKRKRYTLAEAMGQRFNVMFQKPGLAGRRVRSSIGHAMGQS